MSEHSRIRINWTVNAPVMLALVGQVCVLVWMVAVWKTSVESQMRLMEARIALIEQKSTNNSQLLVRVVGVEVSLDSLKQQTQRVETKLDRVIERR